MTPTTRPAGPAFARALSGIRGALVTARPGLVAPYVAPAVNEQPAELDEPAVDDCVSGSCQAARPGGPCDCACGGSAHGSRSTLAPAACAGTKMLADVAAGGGYRWSRCPGCPACAVASIAARVAAIETANARAAALDAADPAGRAARHAAAFAGLPVVDDDPFALVAG